MFASEWVSEWVHAVCLVYEIKSIWESNIPIYKLQFNNEQKKVHKSNSSSSHISNPTDKQTQSKEETKEEEEEEKLYHALKSGPKNARLYEWANSLSLLHAHASTRTHTFISEIRELHFILKFPIRRQYL